MRNHRNTHGFSLIETIVALAVLMIFFTSIAVIVQIIVNLIGGSQVRAIATALGQERIEYMRNLGYTDVGTVGGIPAGVIEPEETITVNNLPFTINTSVVYVDDPFDGITPDDAINTDYKRARISISWGGSFASVNPLVLVTDIAPKGLESTLGGGTLSIVVFDAQGTPIQNASVHIQNATANPAIDTTSTTNTNGEVLLPGAPACTECYQITVTKDGYSTDRTYGTDEVANPIKNHLSVIAENVTETSFTIDTLSDLTVTTTRSRENGYGLFAGVSFILRGSKIIGTTVLDEPVYKYEQTHVTGSNGSITIADLEWDNYDIFFSPNSSVDFAGSNPILPISLLPNSTQGITVVTTQASPHSLLTIVTDPSDTLLADADIHLVSAATDATKSAGTTGKGDMGQAIFSNLSDTESYTLTVSLPSYLEATSTASVSGDIKETIILSPQ